MNPKRLQAFMEVAQAGNLHRAGEKLQVSAAALSKLVAGLEKEWDLKLFDRTNRGLSLTPSGASMYRDVIYLTQYYQEALLRAKEEKNKKKRIIRIGTSPMGGGRMMADLLARIQEESPEFCFEFIPFEVEKRNVKDIFMHFGEKIDLVLGIYDSFFMERYPCQAKIIRQEELACVVPLRNPLSQKDRLQLSDLKGENCWFLKGELEGTMSRIRHDIMDREPDIRLTEISFFDVDAYNQCENEGGILFSLRHWKSLNPLMKIIPLAENYHIPISFFYSEHPSVDVLEFIKKI